VTSIGARAFAYCSALQDIDPLFQPSLESIQSAGAFIWCESLRAVDLRPCSILTEIGSSAFHDCSRLTTIQLPESLESIHSWALSGTSLEILQLPASVKRIDEYAFHSCHALEKIEVPVGLCSVHNLAFRDCGSVSSLLLSSAYSVNPLLWTRFLELLGRTEDDKMSLFRRLNIAKTERNSSSGVFSFLRYHMDDLVRLHDRVCQRLQLPTTNNMDTLP